MKHLYSILITALITFTLLGCSTDDSEEEAPTYTQYEMQEMAKDFFIANEGVTGTQSIYSQAGTLQYTVGFYTSKYLAYTRWYTTGNGLIEDIEDMGLYIQTGDYLKWKVPSWEFAMTTQNYRGESKRVMIVTYTWTNGTYTNVYYWVGIEGVGLVKYNASTDTTYYTLTYD